MKKKVYISGKVTGIKKEAARLFQEAEDFINKEGDFVAVNPMKLDHSQHDKSWEAYMKMCITALMDCDYIFMLNNWRWSEGARVELELATTLRIKRIDVDSSGKIKLI